MDWKIPLYKMYWDEEDVNSIANVIRRGMYWTTGPDIKKFEETLANYVGVKYATVFNSGTSALHAALLAHKIKTGDEVIVPSFTFISTANTVLFVGGKPVFAETEDETYGLNPEDVKEKITNKTKAIIPIHYGGSPCIIKELKEIAEDHNLLIIEDAAESLGAKVGDKYVGTFGDSAMFSFCQNKVITTGDGGAMVTDSKDIYKRLKLIRSHGRTDTKDYFSTTEVMDYISLGFNFRLPDILAALGVSQMKKIDKLIGIRRKNAAYLNDRLSKVKEIGIPVEKDGFFHVYQMYTIKVNGGKEKRDALMEHLKNKGIMTKIYFSPIHLTHFYKQEFGYKEGDLPVTERISDHSLTLPMHAKLTEEEMSTIAKEIENFFIGSKDG